MPMPPGALEAERRLVWTSLGLCFLIGAILGWRQIASPDIGFHLSTARWMVANHAWPSVDTFSFTARGNRYIDLQWLFQLVLYGAHQLGGAAFLIAVAIVATLGFWALLVVRTYRSGPGGGRLAWAVPFLLILIALGDFFEQRPHLFSWLYGSLILLVLEEYTRGNRKWLPALPVIMVLWINTHQLFVLGLVIIGVYAAWELRRGMKADRQLLLWAALSVPACLINPYGIKGLLLPVTLFGEIQGGQVFAGSDTTIAEMQPPFSTSFYFIAGRFVLFQPPLYWHVYTLLSVVGLVAAWRRLRVPNIVLWFMFLFVFSKVHKNFGYFVMATFPITALGLQVLLERIRARRARGAAATIAAAPNPRPLLWAPIVLGAVLIPLILSGRLYKAGWNDVPIGAGFDRTRLPVEASEFLRANHVQGRVLTSMGYGAYVYWATEQPVSLYSLEEVFGPEFFAEYLASLTPRGMPAFLTRWKPTIAVVSFLEAPYWVFYLNQQPDWRLVHYTDSSAVYLHQSVSGLPALPDPKPNADFVPHTRDQMTRAITGAAARPDMSVRAWFQGSDAFAQPTIRLATFFLHTGRFEAAANTAVTAMESSTVRVSEDFLIAGNALNALGDYELSDQCFATVLKSSPDAQTRQQIEQAVKARTGR
jgi:hypothetical protein